MESDKSLSVAKGEVKIGKPAARIQIKYSP